MPHSKAEVIRSYFAAYASGDRKVIEDGFAADFTFTSPYDDAIDKATYFERCWPNNERIEQFALERHFGERMRGLVALVSRGGETHVDAIGKLSFEDDAPMRRDAIFRIASMTKPVTAAAAMILVEDGR